MMGLSGLGDITKLVKQAGAMKQKMEALQEELVNETVTASSGGGMVEATVNGKLQLVGLKIDREVVDPEEKEMLQDLVVAAVAEGQRRASEMVQEKMSEITGGIDLKGLLG